MNDAAIYLIVDWEKQLVTAVNFLPPDGTYIAASQTIVHLNIPELNYGERITKLETAHKHLADWMSDEFDYEPWMTQSKRGWWDSIKAFITGDWR